MSLYWTEVMFESLWNNDFDQLLESISKGADVNALDERGNTLLDIAVGISINAVQTVLSLGANPNTPNSDGNTCLRSSVLEGDIEITRLLLTSGATVDKESPNDGSTSLHVAAEKCLPAFLTLLVEHASQPSLNRFDYVARTPLICAVQNRCIDCAKILIDSGADLNIRDESRIGDVALTFAVENRDVPMVRLLRSAGANAFIPGNMADTPWDKAKRLLCPHRAEILNLLKNP